MRAGTDAPPQAIRGCRAEALIWWLDDELWRVELAGGLREADRSVQAERGRLVTRVAAWDDAAAWALVQACAGRVANAAAAALRATGLAGPAAELAECDGLDELESVAATLAAGGHGRASLLAGFAEDVALYSRQASRAAAAASVAAFIAAYALAGGDKARPGYEPSFEEERRWQTGWLRERLGV